MKRRSLLKSCETGADASYIVELVLPFSAEMDTGDFVLSWDGFNSHTYSSSQLSSAVTWCKVEQLAGVAGIAS